MGKKNLFKSKTNFTLKRLHQSGNYGNIYERDYTTIVNSLENPGGQIPIYNSPTFKLSVSAGLNNQKKYNYGNWVQNPNSCGNVNQWTINCLPEIKEKNNKITLKPHNRKLTDFACFGSAYDLIKVSLSNIIKNFPAELYRTNKTIENIGLLKSEAIPNNADIIKYKEWFIVDNPFSIDILQQVIPENNISNQLRYMCESQFKYDILIEKENNNGDIITEIKSSGSDLEKYNKENGDFKNFWVVNPILDKGCLNNGDLIAIVNFKGFLDNDIYDTILTINCFFYENSIIYLTNYKDVFKIRLNQQIIDDFFENLSDFEKILLNPKTNYSAIFETYVEDNENGWYITEQTYKWPIGEGGWNLSLNGLGYNKYINDLSVLALGYDELFTNSIWKDMAHESIGNMDLTAIHNKDEMDNSKIKQICVIIGRQFDEIKKYIDNIKNTNSISYDQNKNIPDYFLSDELELKGWEVKQILNYVPENIITDTMYEYNNKGFNKIDGNNEFLRRLFLNSKNILSKKGTKQGIEDLMAIFGYHSVDWLVRYYGNNINEDFLTKAFILIEHVYVADGYSFDYDSNTVVSNVKRLNQLKDNFDITNINNDEMNEYEGLPVAEVTYNNKTCLVPWFDKECQYDTNIYFQSNGGWARNDGNNKNDKSVYSYSISKIQYVNNIDDLYKVPYNLLNEDMIYYVSNMQFYYKLLNIEEHYNENGWEIIDDDELSFIENIIETNKGNNPHTGIYDGGLNYLQAYGELFKDSKFNNARQDDINDKLDYGFNINKQADSTKCLYFGNSYLNDNTNPLRGYNRIIPYNFFNEGNYDESASLSVINSKEFHIIFSEEQREFIENDILSYLKQVIPSTSIFSYSFEKIDINNYKKSFDARTGGVICNGEICPINSII